MANSKKIMYIYFRCGDDDHDTSIGMSRMLANVKRRHGLRGAQSRLNLEESSPGCLPELLVDQRHLDPPGACQSENLTINGGAWGENREKRSVNIPPCLASKEFFNFRNITIFRDIT